MKWRLLFFLLLVSFSASTQDEFKDWSEDSLPVQNSTAVNLENPPSSASPSLHKHANQQADWWLLGTVAATAIAGLFVRFKYTRILRPFFLVGSVALLGFYHASCPCPVGGFIEGLLYFFSPAGNIKWIWWFVAILPLTYFFGRVWCGWICHLGALQELLFMKGRFHFLTSAKSQTILRHLRMAILISLILQVAITHTNVWKHIDPFKAAYNLYASNTISWILLGIVAGSSILMFRPFCKVACPVGLVLGWVSKLKGAAVIKVQEGCINCKSCSQVCSSHAFSYSNKQVTLDRQECIACGECIDACPVHTAGVFHLGAFNSRQEMKRKKSEAVL